MAIGGTDEADKGAGGERRARRCRRRHRHRGAARRPHGRGDAAATAHRQAVAGARGCRRHSGRPRQERRGHEGQDRQEGVRSVPQPVCVRLRLPQAGRCRAAQGDLANRKQMMTYTSVVLAFLAFMVALIGLADFGLAKLVLLVFG
ncbi:preprotein translocase, SecE subunit [Mycobacterium xenopi 3993]|nr:preprotein translocase, SecE subunit [Mycobacterium xenopi 3993]